MFHYRISGNLLSVAVFWMCGMSAADSLETVANRLANDLARAEKFEQPSALIASQRFDGSWPDVDYASQARSMWDPGVVHLKRQGQLAAAYRLTGDAAALTACQRAMAYWFTHDFRNSNWWWNEIGVPKAFAETAFCLGGALTSQEREWIVRRLGKTTLGKRTGQNRAWMAELLLAHALLVRDAAAARAALNVIFDEIRISDREGIRSDWCFHQHGPQPQFGNYGLSFLALQSRLAELCAGTELAMPADKFGMLCNLAEKGFAWTVWNGRMDVGAIARQLFPRCAEDKAKSVFASFNRLERAGWRRPPAPTGFRFFDRSAYAVFRTGTWMASVKASTPTVIGTETWVNEDNALGMCMGDGALYVYRTGDEYQDVFPLWDDWRMIPGVTGYRGKPVVRTRMPNDADEMSAAASGPGTNVVTFAFRREGLSLRKRWTFTESAVLCEGSDLTATDGDYEVVTCVEHSCAQADAACVYARDDESCFVNGGVRYVVQAPREAIDFAVEERTGDFSRFMRSLEPTPAKGRVFSLRIRHGRLPSGAAYRYRILP